MNFELVDGAYNTSISNFDEQSSYYFEVRTLELNDNILSWSQRGIQSTYSSAGARWFESQTDLITNGYYRMGKITDIVISDNAKKMTYKKGSSMTEWQKCIPE